MELRELSERIGSQLDDMRERTAQAVSGEGAPIMRELHRISQRLDRMETRLDDRLDELTEERSALLDEIMSSGNRTTWPRRMFWMAVGVGAGMLAAYLADPDRGRARRAEMTQQLSARARDVSEEVTTQAKMAVDRARGAAVESAKSTMPEDIPDDPKILHDRIRSQVFGYRDDVQDVIIKVDAPGTVALKGTVPNPDSERDLLAAVADVEGVIDVRSELNVRT